MRSGSTRFLVDTNIPVCAYDPADALKQQRARQTLQTLEANRTGALSVQVMGEFFNTVTRKILSPMSSVDAQRSLTNYYRTWVIFDITVDTVMEAVSLVQRRQLSYWDGLILATAKLNGVPNILSQDGNHGAVLDGVRYLNPFNPSFDLAVLTT